MTPGKQNGNYRVNQLKNVLLWFFDVCIFNIILCSMWPFRENIRSVPDLVLSIGLSKCVIYVTINIYHFFSPQQLENTTIYLQVDSGNRSRTRDHV